MALLTSPMNKTDVLIVGAGPIALAASNFFAKKGKSVVIIEKLNDVKTATQRSFMDRHHQIGLNPESLAFLKNLDIVVWGQIDSQSCSDGNWKNLPIFMIQQILFKALKNYSDRVHFLCNTT